MLIKVAIKTPRLVHVVEQCVSVVEVIVQLKEGLKMTAGLMTWIRVSDISVGVQLKRLE